MMFSPKQRFYRRMGVVAAGAVAVGLIAAVSQAATIEWDPAKVADVTISPGGGIGNFNNDDANFWDATKEEHVKIEKPFALGEYFYGDAVVFGGTGADVYVTRNADGGYTTVGTLTLNASGYAFKDKDTSTNYRLHVGPESATGTFITQIGDSSTSNSIHTTLAIGSGVSSGNVYTVDIQAGQLYVRELVTQTGVEFYGGVLRKAGAGLLQIDSLYADGIVCSIDVAQGKLLLGGHDNNNRITFLRSVGLVAAGDINNNAVLAGNATIKISNGGTIPIYGHIAPGTVSLGSNFDGAAGMLAFELGALRGHSIRANFHAGSSLDLDLGTPDFNLKGDPTNAGNHDVLNFICGEYSWITVNIFNGAQVNINAIGGTLQEGIYRIITINNAHTPGYENEDVGLPIFGYYADATSLDDHQFDGKGFTVSNLPAGYEYEFSPYYESNYAALDLIITFVGTSVPEPASLGLLGLGGGLMLLRRRR